MKPGVPNRARRPLLLSMGMNGESLYGAWALGFRFCPVQKEDESSLPKGTTGPQGYTQCLNTGVSREETLYNARKRKHPLPKPRCV